MVAEKEENIAIGMYTTTAALLTLILLWFTIKLATIWDSMTMDTKRMHQTLTMELMGSSASSTLTRSSFY